MSPFVGKVVIVTGAGSGLGREYALALAAHGASVVVNDLGIAVSGDAPTGDPARLVADEIISRGGRAVASDDIIADWVGAENILGTVLHEFGRLDVVVNDAGNNRPRSLVELSQADAELPQEHLTTGHFTCQ